MMKRPIAIGVLVATALLLAGVLYASNMGFKLNYRLASTGEGVPGGTSFNGTNPISLPYNRSTGVDTASALFDDIGSANVQNIQRYVQSNNGIELYSTAGGDFGLSSGEGYFIRMKTGTDYIVMGSHDPTLAVTLAGSGEPVAGGTSANGTNFFAHPYHGTASNAQELADDIGSANVLNIQRYIESNNGIEIFSPGGASPFPLTIGEAYFVRISGGVTASYTPSHY